MKAVVANQVGGPEVLNLSEIDKPKPGAGELLVKVAACALNPVDYKIRNGYLSDSRMYPAIYGYDISGVVESVGEGVNSFKPGNAVYYLADLQRQGGYAEYHVVMADLVDHKPPNLTSIEAASLPLVSCTAYQGLFDHACLQASAKVLIIGAPGGVGSVATQMAAWHVAEVIAVCSTKNIDYVKGLGADHVIDYTSENIAGRVMDITKGSGVDIAYDLVGGDGFASAVDSASTLGRVVFLNAITNNQQTFVDAMNAARNKNLTVHCARVMASGALMHKVTRLVNRGFLKPQVDQVISLSQVSEAHNRLASMHGRGKIVIDLTKGE